MFKEFGLKVGYDKKHTLQNSLSNSKNKTYSLEKLRINETDCLDSNGKWKAIMTATDSISNTVELKMCVWLIMF